ncbi:MAG: hypothetical protein KBG48_03715 [Kofleriaceae bacterium]|nr:hypothetical protein [Kofleriaceae bacterium]MBP9166463.1 hypothetical protein [Kofleriaceae bacterium]MBP9860306.1 hypothetical protein [Kofleriaceae bacterium]
MRPAFFALALVGAVACSDDAAQPIDAAVDGPAIDAPDAGPCGADVNLAGAYEDWDSTTGAFDGIEFATWTVRGTPGRTAMTAPNGRVGICIASAGTTAIDATQAEYVPAIYLADPAVFVPPGAPVFQVKGLRTTRLEPFLTSIGVTRTAGTGLVLVQQMGTARALTLGGTHGPQFAVDDALDITWTADGIGMLTLFTNVAPGQPTLGAAGAIVGPTALTVEADKLTITTIR